MRWLSQNSIRGLVDIFGTGLKRFMYVTVYTVYEIYYKN
jgi:hypothetical protein